MSYLTWAANNRVALAAAAVAAFAGYTVPYIFPEWKPIWRVSWWPAAPALDVDAVKNVVEQLLEEKKKPTPFFRALYGGGDEQQLLAPTGMVPYNQPWCGPL